VIEVVREPDAHAALRRGDERGANDLGGLVAEAEVVERQVEAAAGAPDELGDSVRDRQRRLAAVRQQAQLDAVASRR